jgi:hypothetical protein
LAIAVFRLVMEVVRPAAVARVYIGRLLELMVMWSIAWCLVRIVDVLLNRVESNMAGRHEFSGRSILRLGRRTASVTIIIIVILMVLSSWGYNTATLVAGLGVGGIAIALAAQQTIANIFGGVAVIGDHPVSIGDFGKFGDIIGTVEDIGMRSTQVRTLSRTVISVPNSTFASANLENYSVRDKILFNPDIPDQTKHPDEEVWRLIDALAEDAGGQPIGGTGGDARAIDRLDGRFVQYRGLLLRADPGYRPVLQDSRRTVPGYQRRAANGPPRVGLSTRRARRQVTGTFLSAGYRNATASIGRKRNSGSRSGSGPYRMKRHSLARAKRKRPARPAG